MPINTPEIITKDEFKGLVTQIEATEGYERPHAFGVGVTTLSAKGERLDAWFPSPNLAENYGSAAILANAVDHKNGTKTYTLSREQIDAMLAQFAPFLNDGNKHPNIDVLRNLLQIEGDARREIVATFIGADVPSVIDISDAYLRLHLLSHLKVQPNGINLDGIFGKLPNVAWTNEGPIAIDEVDERRMQALRSGTRLSVFSQDKFPAMLDYVTPHPNVRITNARNVRLGAHVAPGTTVMTAGSINFNSGTIGEKAMVEGRISAGVKVGTSDIGGGASTQGTLSGGGKEKITIGDNCLVGANAGVGISLGDNCTVDAGLYLTAGTKVYVTETGEVVKASGLSGRPDLFFRRDSQSGRVEVKNKSNEVGLNETLHRR